MRFIFLFLLNTILVVNIFSQNKIVLQGMIGHSLIFMQIEKSDTEDKTAISAIYFYKNSLRDIIMEGNWINNKLTLFVHKNDKSYDEKFVLNSLNNKSFEGKWNDKKGQKLRVTLTEINPNSFQNKYDTKPFIKKLKSENIFDYIRTSFFEFKQDSIIYLNKKQFIWYSEKHTSNALFRLGTGFKKSAFYINDILDETQFSNISDQLERSSDMFYSNADDENVIYTTTINFVNNDLLGYEIFSSWFCCGAHPDFAGQGYLYDLNKNKNYDIDEIISFDEPNKVYNEKDLKAFSEYRESLFAPMLSQIIDEQYHFTKTESDSTYNYSEVEIWQYPSWSFTNDGIAFTPSLARALRCFEEPFLVPFAKLKKYKHPKFPYSLNL